MIDTFNIVVSCVAIISTVGGWVTIVVRGVKVRTELDSSTKADIQQLKEKVDRIDKVISNGGLRDMVTQMQTNCGKEMSKVVTLLESHEKLPSHTGIAERVARLEERTRGKDK